jgi:glycosyltransferase involved in cell wall biosynthesis
MVIAINTRFILKDYSEGYGNFTFETSTRLAASHPEHRFIFIFDRPVDIDLIFPPNVTVEVKGPPARHPLLWWYWYNISLPAVARKHKASVIINPDGFCSLNTSIPQCLVVHDLAFLHFPEHLKKTHTWFYKRYTPRALKKAKTICTVSLFTKNDIISHYKTDEAKLNLVYSGIRDEFHPIDFEAKEQVKEKYTAGNEYFLYVGAIHPRKNLMNLLRAFSIFKKRQKSNMKLVIVGRLAWNVDEFTKKLTSYKFKNDVVTTGYLLTSELVNVTASAYALVYPSLLEGFGVPPLEAMRSGVPVVASTAGAIPEVCSDAALFADPLDPADIADKMMLLYKDEELRRTLIAKGFHQAEKFNWNTTADLLWQSILKACGN